MNYTIGSNRTHPMVTQDKKDDKDADKDGPDTPLSDPTEKIFTPEPFFSNTSYWNYFKEAYRGL